jgi:hypothetical protein
MQSGTAPTPGRAGRSLRMSISMVAMTVTDTEDEVIDLRSHRVAELVQVLAGCRPEAAELAVAPHLPTSTVSPDDALNAVAHALVCLRAPARDGKPATARDGDS